ncbi:MAG: hypothetical protein K0R57_6596 [Paenibacillaceae bacterium]|jgi:cytoplasmic iron level regulating protein YaaA (DUF328/UPF0246 family)|nr:hypothetical protein [Paenibacillaceae bacterium]
MEFEHGKYYIVNGCQYRYEKQNGKDTLIAYNENDKTTVKLIFANEDNDCEERLIDLLTKQYFESLKNKRLSE